MGTYIFDAILTPEEGSGYSVEFPTLPGCFTDGDDYHDAAYMAADAAKTWVASHLKHGEPVPEYCREEAPEGSERLCVFFEVDESYIVNGPVVSAAQAARELGVSAGRITHMIDAGLLEGYRNGRRTYVTESSIAVRKASPRGAGRPRKEPVEA
ncbi:type II toxin-antitoxin system HicB family antitoxin [uncultured Slackia sp.]|uniref:type II toxin-antitoxin system HicB family antitoxin n=1 Tax=uncultured Slackia sp. TaxID=665903 RepID=UPI0025FE2E34|nr:type II toxin-antitoxin system HicB family antitoxin [uncultured Slackia sp.]